MVNTNIQGPVPLQGAGFVSRRNGNFQPGEFKRLSNVEVSDNGLMNRRSVKSVAGDSQGSVIESMTNSFGFIGHIGTHSILASGTEQVAVGPGAWVPMWAPSLLPKPASDFSFHKLIGYFRFNNVNYWLTLEYDSASHIKIKAYYGDIDIDNDKPSTYDAAYFATLSTATLYTILASDINFNKFDFRNFFIQGTRLWLVTSLGIYFSKATDPSVFAVPDGGFFKFPDQRVNYGVSLRDNIYVFCDNSIHTVTYSTDPNLDSTVNQISDNVGGESATVHSDAVYAINQVGIYRIMNNSVDKIVDNEFDVGLDYYTNSITAFEDYLVVNKYRDVNYEKFDANTSQMRTNLLTNPSVGTNFNNWTGNTTYFERSRSAYASSYSGDYVHLVKKITDLTEVIRQNLIANPSFEVNTVGYTANAEDGFSLERIIPSGGAPSGTYATRIIFDPGSVSPTKDNGRGGYHKALLFDTPIAITNEEYTFRCMKARNATWDNSRQKLYFYYTIRDADGGFLYAGNHLIPTETVDTYEEFKITIPARAGAATIEPEFKVYFSPFDQGLGTHSTFRFFLDALSLERSATFDAAQPYFDGDTADTTYRTYNWSGTAHASISQKKGGEGTGKQRHQLAIHTNVAVSPSTSYTLGFAVRPILGARSFEVVIRQYNGTGNLLSETTTATDSAEKGVWTYLSKSFTTAVGCASIQFEIHSLTYMFVSEFLYLDAFILEETETYSGYFDGAGTDVGTVLTYSWTGTPHASTSTYILTAIPRRLYSNGRRFVPGQQGNTLGYNTFFINMMNGSVHVLEYTDARDASSPGQLVEIVVNPNKDSSGNYNLFFITNRMTSETSATYTFKANAYYMSSYRDNHFIDYAVQANNTLQVYPPKIDIEIDSFVPDGSEYLVKKYRNLMVMAKIPTTGFQLQFGFDEGAYGPKIDLTSEVIGERPHHPYRVGINQRAKAMSIRFTNDSHITPLADYSDYDVVQISDIRTLWGYTGHPVGVRKLV